MNLKLNPKLPAGAVLDSAISENGKISIKWLNNKICVFSIYGNPHEIDWLKHLLSLHIPYKGNTWCWLESGATGISFFWYTDPVKEIRQEFLDVEDVFLSSSEVHINVTEGIHLLENTDWGDLVALTQ